jgi:choline dehydrogenase-like flavoprotein
MYFDFNEAWSRVSKEFYDVCVCGTGPAGITTARKLAAQGKRVLLLEGGGLSYSDESQDLYTGTSIGRRYWHVENGRLRYLGGTSNHWSGRCGVFDQVDFENRDYFGLPGWPISRQRVMAHLEEAQDILDIGGKDLSPFQNPEFQSAMFAQSGFTLSPPTRFAEKYEAELRQSERIDLFYNANLVDIRLNDDRTRVDSLSVENSRRHRVQVTAKQHVLALGAIETARLLLNSNSQVPEGVGNRSGMVGRCFMEHLNVSIGRFLVTNPQFWQNAATSSPTRSVALAATEKLIKQYNVGNGIVNFEPESHPQSYGRLRVLKQFLRETSCQLPSVANLARKFVDFDCPSDGLITSLIEQTPNMNSRVSLTNATDKLGLRRIQLDWQLSDGDKNTIRSLAIVSAQEMARLDLARIQLAPFITNKNLDIEVGAHAHQMGTTRMSSDPKFGVVNERCQVHGIENLYLIGSSVFPTGGGTNPTLTIVMLSLYLTEILGECL